MRYTLVIVGLLIVLAAPCALAETPATTATATVCAQVKDRVCQGAGESFAANVGQVFCLSEIKGGADKVVHVWIFGEKEMASIDLPVKGPRWRTWSAKRILPTQKGAWRVEVRAADGQVLANAAFKVE